MQKLNILKYQATKFKIQKLTNMNDGPIKLNIGCGTDYKDGWINIDNNSDNNIKKLDLNWDLRNALPFKDETIDFIFHEHFMEHLTPQESLKSLNDFKRVLKPGGVMRIAMPDMEDIFDLYKDNKWKSRPIIKNHGFQFVKTRAELVNMSFSWWGHKWIYDWEELCRRLDEVGFTKNNIKRCKLKNSTYKDLVGLETREGSILIAEVSK